MTKKQAEQFNIMRNTLIKISKGYMTTEQLRKNSEKLYGLDFEECIEMTYDNIQADAKHAVKGVKEIKLN